MLKKTDNNVASAQMVRPLHSQDHKYGYGQPTGLTMMELWRRLMRQKWLFLLTTLLVTLIAAWITFSIQPSYRAMGTIQIEKEAPEIVSFGDTSSKTPDLGEQDAFFRTQYEQLKSRNLAQQVIEKLNLEQRLYLPEQQKEKSWIIQQIDTAKTFLKTHFFNLIGKKDDTEAEVNLSGMDAYIAEFQAKLYVEPIEKTHLVNVFFESTDAELSAQIVNTLIDEFIKGNINTQSETDNLATEFLTQEMDKARDRLTASETELVEYAQNNDILEVNNSQSTQENKLNGLYNAYSQALQNRVQTEGAMLQGRRNGNSAGVMTNPVVESLKRQLVSLEADYQDKSKIFKPAYPDMQQLSQKINVLRNRLKTEMLQVGSSLQGALNAEFKTAKRLENDLRSQLDSYKNELGGLRDRSIEYNALKREVEVNRSLYDGILQRMKEVNIASSITPSNIRIVDEASKPIGIFRPQRTVNLIIGGLIGLLLGAGLALLRESMSQKLHSVDELQSISDLPIIGSIPTSRGNEQTLSLVAARDLGSPVSEAYRIAAANLRFSANSGTLPHSTVITSVNPAEGKSTSSVNLALSFAQMGTKVLLIDADLRRPTLHSKMGLHNHQGLSNFLMDEATLSSVTQAFHEVPNLYVITAGSLLEDPVKLISSAQMRQLINLSIKHFDAVIIDAPPVTGFADALLLASMAEATVLVANEKTIERRRLQDAIEQLSRASNHLAGFLMVKAKERVTNERYYKRYKRRYESSATSSRKSRKRGLNLSAN